MLGQNLFDPILSPILRDRKIMFVISGAALLQLGLASLKLPSLQCPILQVLGIPCPGCGLTRAIVWLFRGDWHRSVTFHAFAPAFVVALTLIALTAMLPKTSRERVGEVTESIERRTGITGLLLLALVIYWLARLLILRSEFVKLIQG
jgi:hypothetical protein